MESHPVVSEKALGGAKELASSGDSLPSFSELGSAMSVPDREADENVVFTGEMPSGIDCQSSQKNTLVL